MGIRTKLLVSELSTGESRTYASIDELARQLYQASLANGNLDSITNYLSRVSAKGGVVYGLRLRRIPLTMDLDTARRYTRVISAAEKMSALVSRIMDDPTPDVEFADSLEEYAGILEVTLQDHYGELDVEGLPEED